MQRVWEGICLASMRVRRKGNSYSDLHWPFCTAERFVETSVLRARTERHEETG
jgi:hypothetical protein